MNAERKTFRWQNLALSVAAVSFGLVGVAGTHSFIDQSLKTERARLAGDQQTIETVVAKTDLPAGSVVGHDTMAVRQMPVRFLPGTAVRAAQFDDVAGMQLTADMVAGQALVTTNIGQLRPGFSDRVGHGVRAMTVAVDEVNSVSGMLAPGDRIDLLFSTRPPRTDGQAATEVTAPLMQDLLILATGQLTERQQVEGQPGHNRAFTSITVAVTPEQAQRLVLAQRSGRLTALLRNPTDRREQRAGPMDVYKLLGLDRPGQPKRPRLAGPQVIVGGLGPIKTADGSVSPVAGVPVKRGAPDQQANLPVGGQQISREAPDESN